MGCFCAWVSSSGGQVTNTDWFRQLKECLYSVPTLYISVVVTTEGAMQKATVCSSSHYKNMYVHLYVCYVHVHVYKMIPETMYEFSLDGILRQDNKIVVPLAV